MSRTRMNSSSLGIMAAAISAAVMPGGLPAQRSASPPILPRERTPQERAIQDEVAMRKLERAQAKRKRKARAAGLAVVLVVAVAGCQDATGPNAQACSTLTDTLMVPVFDGVDTVHVPTTVRAEVCMPRRGR